MCPGPSCNSFIVATAVMFINLDLRQSGRLCLCPPALSGPCRRLQLRPDQPADSDRGHGRSLLPDRAGLGLINSYWALIAIYSVLTLPFTTLVLTLYFRGVPEEIDEAAQVEGASPWRILRDICIPLALPSLVGAGLFAFMLAYSEFLFALFITTTRERRTLPVILGALSANTDVSWNMLMASITIGVIPTLLLAFPVWRYMVRGLTSGAVR